MSLYLSEVLAREVQALHPDVYEKYLKKIFGADPADYQCILEIRARRRQKRTAKRLDRQPRAAGATAVASEPNVPDLDEVRKELTAKDARKVFRAIHRVPGGRTALCLSGGGIRSAAFSLGVIQGLASRNLLNSFHYLSSVSGGGYIASWLSAWIARAGLSKVLEDLQSGGAKGHEPEEVRLLRTNSNFLTPKVGIFSGDTWAGISAYLRNLLLNWLIIIPVFLAILLILRMCNAGLSHGWPYLDWPQIGINEIDWTAALYLGPNMSEAFPPWLQMSAGLGVLGLFVTKTAFILSRPTWRFFNWRQTTVLGVVALGLASGLALALPAAAVQSYLTQYSAKTGELLFLGKLAPWDVWLLTTMVTTCAAIHALAWLFAWWLASRRRRRWPSLLHFASAWTMAGDLLAWTAAGAVYGGGLWLGAYLLWPASRLMAPPEWMWHPLLVTCFGVFWVALSEGATNAVFAGLVSSARRGDEDREWWARYAGLILFISLTLVIATVLALIGPRLETYRESLDGSLNTSQWAVAAASGSTLVGLLTALLAKSSLSPARALEVARATLGNRFTKVALAVGTTLFFIGLVITLGIVLDAFLSTPGGKAPDPLGEFWWSFLVLGIVTVIGLSASGFVNVNRFSLHALYRERLTRAFLGPSNCLRRLTGRARRGMGKPEKIEFTGFDETDNIPLHRLWPCDPTAAPTPRQPDPPSPERHRNALFPVINAALNVVATDNLSWQERKARSFTFTPFACGSHGLGYQDSKRYGNGITLGTAMAISGAAVSPNMGYHSSAPLAFLMTLFNVRLGWWLPNPRKEDAKLIERQGPRFAFNPLFFELIGRTTEDYSYVYLSDGGHFENLGLYEMILRRCHLIVVVDAGQDEECAFEDLGNAVRKISIDFGVRIDFGPMLLLEKRQTPANDGPACAVATITYPESRTPEGTLIYIKPGYHGNEPADIRSYANTNPLFPHEKTSDQWFSESQFESYRALGQHTINRLVNGSAAGSLPSLPLVAKNHVKVYSVKTKPPPANVQTIPPIRKRHP